MSLGVMGSVAMADENLCPPTTCPPIEIIDAMMEMETETFADEELTPAEVTLTFDKFDTMGGTRELIRVEICTSSCIVARVTLENDSETLNTDSASVELTADQTLEIFPGTPDLLGPFFDALNPPLQENAPPLTASTPPDDGGTDFHDFGVLCTNLSTSQAFTAAADLAPFVANGGSTQFDVDLELSGGWQANGITESTLMVTDFFSDGVVKVRYYFEVIAACCFNDGSCQVLDPVVCAEMHGVPQAGIASCDPNPCPQPRACCLSDGSCVDLIPSRCMGMDGVVQKEGELCIPDQIDCKPDPEPGSCNEKGSLLVFSKVEIRWDDQGNLIQDCFVQLTNDYPYDVKVQLYFINGDEPLDPVLGEFGGLIERGHPGWNWVDNLITLTNDQSIYWSVATGQPAGTSPFGSSLDPGFPPGRPCPDIPDERCMRGYIVGWAVNSATLPIRWDHLSGEVTFVNYAQQFAWAYTACAFAVADPAVAHNEVVGDQNPADGFAVLNLDGCDYEAVPDMLHMCFLTDGSARFSEPNEPVITRGDLTLHPVSGDFRQETDGPITTKASITVWDPMEHKFGGPERCITCWDQTLFAQYAEPPGFDSNNLLMGVLGAEFGKARIDGLASQLCNEDFDPNNNADFPFPPGEGDPIDPRDVISTDAALLGLRVHFLQFANAGVASADTNAAAGINLTGMGKQTATIKYDVVGFPPSGPDAPGWNGRTPVGADEVSPTNDAIDTFLFETASGTSSD